eukprot:5717222-Prymnesium_polylepis.1
MCDAYRARPGTCGVARHTTVGFTGGNGASGTGGGSGGGSNRAMAERPLCAGQRRHPPGMYF